MMVMDQTNLSRWRCSFGSQPGGMSAGPLASWGSTSATGGSADFGARRKQSRTTGQQKQSKIPLTVAQWNAEGIRNKKPELQEFLRKFKVDILCAQETHLTENHRFFIRGYEVFRHDRTNKHKGGVIILVKNHLAAVEAHRMEEDGTESISVNILLPSGKLTMTNCYCAPTKQLQLHKIPIQPSNHLILGDFNGHSPRHGSQRRGH